MSLNDVIFIENLPKLDIHGLDRDTAKMRIRQFIEESIAAGHKNCVIVHGLGTGILRKVTHDELAISKEVNDYKIWFFNAGCTVIELKNDQ